MLDYKIINRKPKIEYNNEKYLDLLAQTYVNIEDPYATLCVVNKYYVARPDLISLAYYKDDSFGDIICKVNGISNPFELNENDVLIIPSIEFINECTQGSSNASAIISKDDDITKLDQFNKRKLVSEKRTPNEQTINDSNYVIDKSLGVVFY